MGPNRQHSFFSSFRQCVSKPRLEAYRQAPSDRLEDLVDRYFWNLDLCEALYPAFHLLEVGLRNELDRLFCAITGDDSWFFDQAFVRPREYNTARKTEQRIQGRVMRGKLIAELSFGYWTSLFRRHYHNTNPPIWDDAFFKSSPYSPFPGAPNRWRNRKALGRRFNSIRKLRNRVFHHEPIWNRSNLREEYDDILEAIGWISLELRDALERYCRFPDVYCAGSPISHRRWKNTKNRLNQR